MDNTRRYSKILLVALLLAAAGCSPGPLKIGVVLPASAEYQSYAEEIRKGIDLALEETPSVDGRPIVLVVGDYTGRAHEAADVLRSQIENDQIYASVAGTTEAEFRALVPVADEGEIILIAPTATGNDAVGRSIWAFTLWPAKSLECTKIATLARQDLIKYLVVAWAQGSYGQGFKNEFIPAFERQRGDVLAVSSFSPGLDEKAALDLAHRLAEPKPQAVLIIAPEYRDVVALLIPLKEAGFGGKVLATSTFGHPAALEEAGGAAEGVIFTAPGFDPASSKTAETFTAAYRKAHGSDPTIWAVYGYDAMKALLGALEGSSKYSKDTVGVLRRLSDFPGAGGTISFDTKGRVVRAMTAYTVQDGKAVPYVPGPATPAGN